MYSYTSPAKFAAILFVALVTLYVMSTVPINAAVAAPLLYTGCHTITPEEQQALKSAGATIPSNGQFCDKDKVLLYGSCSSSPIPYLESKRANSGVDVSGFNADFACRLSKFLQAADAAGMNIRITSGYRSVAKQAALYANRTLGVPVAPPGRSKHNFGIAADLTFDGVWPSFKLGAGNTPACLQRLRSCRWAHDNNTTFGLKYPMQVEPWHIEPGTAVRGATYLPTDPNYWSSDNGTTYTGVPLAPAQSFPQPAMVTSLPSSASSASQTPSTGSTASTQPQICSPSFSCTGNIMYYKTTSCTEQVYQTCPYGCGETSCNLSTSTSATTGTGVSNIFATSTNTNTNTNDNSSEATSSVSDILNSYLNPTAVEIGTSTSLAFRLNPETGDIEQIPVITNTGSLSPASGVISSIQPVAGQQTFTSSDLSGSGGYFSSQQQASSFQKVLEGMKSALLWAINALRSL